MGLARALWFVAVAILGLPFLDGLRRGGGGAGAWLRRATASRVVLGCLEIAAVLAWAVWLRGRIPIGDEWTAALALAGAVTVLAGAVITGWARLALGRWFSPNLGVREQHQLITTGPYALVRHPIYLGLILFVAGSALVWNDGGLLVLAGVLGLLLGAHIPIEERMFRHHFGEAFERYRARTPALLPWPRPRSSTL